MPKPGRRAVLTPDQERFAEEYAATLDVKKAYTTVFGEGKDTKRNAYRLWKKPLVKAHIKELMMERYAPLVLDQQERIRILSDIALTGETKDSLKAIDMLNKMEQIYTIKMDVNMKVKVKYQNLEDWYKNAE